RLTFMFKVQCGNVPHYVSTIFDKYKKTNIRDVRNVIPFQVPLRRSRIRSRSPTFLCMTEFNGLSSKIRNCDTIKTFKNNISQLFLNNDIILASELGINRADEIYLNRIRVDLIFNAHLHAHNFVNVNSPECICGDKSETTKHVIFSCPIRQPFYISFEQKLFDLLPNYRHLCKNRQDKLDLFLFGHPSLSLSKNHEILASSALFIRQCFERPQAV
ncbi:unnamed protein product, partial [Owenia fusiformis]